VAALISVSGWLTTNDDKYKDTSAEDEDWKQTTPVRHVAQRICHATL